MSPLFFSAQRHTSLAAYYFGNATVVVSRRHDTVDDLKNEHFLVYCYEREGAVLIGYKSEQ